MYTTNLPIRTTNVAGQPHQAADADQARQRLGTLIERVKRLRGHIQGMDALHERVPAENIKVLLDQRAVEARALRNDIASELSQAASNATWGTEAELHK